MNSQPPDIATEEDILTLRSKKNKQSPFAKLKQKSPRTQTVIHNFEDILFYINRS